MSQAALRITALFKAGAHHIDLRCACCGAHLDGRSFVQWEAMSGAEQNIFAQRVESEEATITALAR
jgi:hypothetical protein